jgi:hypothetical protein
MLVVSQVVYCNGLNNATAVQTSDRKLHVLTIGQQNNIYFVVMVVN